MMRPRSATRTVLPCLAGLLAFAAALPARAQLRPETTAPAPQPAPAPKPAPAAKSTRILIETVPNAHVYVDDVFKGEASPEGRLVVDDAKPGVRKIRVSLDGKRPFQQDLTVVAGKDASLKADLADLAGSIKVRSSPGAAVYIDGAQRGTTDPSGDLEVAEVSAGAHSVRVAASGKKEFTQQVTVTAGQSLAVNAPLADAERPGPPPGEVKTNRVDGLAYVWIPPGTFMMGCSPGDTNCRAEETPAHLVAITRGFWIGQTEVTVAAAERFVQSRDERMLPPPYFNPNWMDQNMPMVNVSWNDAQVYCHWAGGRLPTEAEWEYAARAGDTSPRYGAPDDIAWFSENSGRKRLNTAGIVITDEGAYERMLEKNGNGTHDVAQKKPNALGLYDMLGNASEWVADWYSPTYYQTSPAQDPQGPPGGEMRVRRGAAWPGNVIFVRFSARLGTNPEQRLNNIGFRCVIQ